MRHPARADKPGKIPELPVAASPVKGREGVTMTAEERRVAINRVLEMVRLLPNGDGISAARSQDFLYGDDGLPE